MERGESGENEKDITERVVDFARDHNRVDVIDGQLAEVATVVKGLCLRRVLQLAMSST